MGPPFSVDITSPNFEPVGMYTHATDAGWISRTHRAIKPFRLRKPETVTDALGACADSDNATIIAGGIDLIRRMRNGDSWDALIDISGIRALRGITDLGGSVRIGALTTHWDIETDPVLAERLPDFQAAWKTIGNVRVRMTGTIGGNLMAAEAGYDGRVLLGAMGGTMIFHSGDGQYSAPAAADFRENLAPSLLTGVEIPVFDGARLAFDRSLKPVVSVAAQLHGDVARIGVGCAFKAPQFWSGPVDDMAGALPVAFPDPINNPMGGGDYRRRMIGVLAARLILTMQEEARP